jgi:peptidyl-tRNA hydrolase, PTH1 family
VARFAKLFGRGERTPPRVDRVVVGLGNPGDGYAATRHNVGFQVASRLAKRARAEFAVKAADSRIAEGTIDGVRVAIARPQTFMNDSGRAVRKLLDRYRVSASELLVVFDEVDLPLGTIRLRERGGPGTHNGMRSIVSLIGENFPRLRVGVAPADAGAEIGDLVEYVLTPFAADERDAAERSLARAAEAAEVALRDGIQPAMARFNG